MNTDIKNQTGIKNQEELEINLLSMLLSVMTHWRSLIIVMVISLAFGIVLPNFSKTEDQEILESQQRIEAVYRYKQLVDKAEEYIAESPYFQIDPNNAWVGTLSFTISAEEKTETISQQFKSILNDGNFASDSMAAYGQDIQWQYLRQMIGCSIDRYEYSAEGADSLTVMLTEVITMSVTMDNEEDCTAILNVVRSYVEAKRSELALDSEYQLLSDSVQARVSDNVKSVIEAKEAELAEYQESYETKYDEMSEEEQAIYESIYITGETDKETAFAEMESDSFNISLKWMVVAAFLGAVLWAVWWIIPYLLSDCLRDNGEVRSFCTLPVLACVRTEGKKHTPIDRWIASLWTKAFGPYQSEEYLCSVLNRGDAPNTALSVAPTSAVQRTLAEHVCAACPQVSQKESYHCSAQSVAELREGDRVIVLVETGATKRAELVSEVETLRRGGADIAGLVVLD